MYRRAVRSDISNQNSTKALDTRSAPRKFLVKTLGCKANLYDSQLIEAELKKRGWEPAQGMDDEDLELCVVNSCTVTDEADKQSRKLGSRLGKDRKKSGLKKAQIVMTGCGAEVNPEAMAKAKGIDYVIANRDKPQMIDLLLREIGGSSGEAEDRASDPADSGKILGVAESYQEMRSRHPMDREWPAPEVSLITPGESTGGESDRTRAFLKIQDGCDSFCTYCIIPYGRGPARSLKIPAVVERVKELVDQGYREAVITGINIGDFGKDWSEDGKPRVEALIEAVLKETKISRLRVSSLDPVEITPELIDIMKSEPRFCPHFHVSLQSPHSKVLKLMKRKYGWDDVRECLERIAAVPSQPGGPFIGMDVITGFPGETEEFFEWGAKVLSELPWSRLHVFPYSERAGTPATRLPGSVPQHERIRRSKVLRELSLKRLESVYRSALDQCRSRNQILQNVLIEGFQRGPDGSRNWLSGYTDNYLRVLIQTTGLSEGISPEKLMNQVIAVMPETVIIDKAAGDAAFVSRVASFDQK